MDARTWLIAGLALAPLAACTPVLTSPGDDSGTGAWVAPSNTWPVSAPPVDLVAQGFDQGQVVPDFVMMDQHGDPVSLWQFYGMVVVVDISTMWCGPCAALADEVDATWNAYEPQGFIYLTVLPENTLGQVPSQDDLNVWADNHAITAPVLQDDIERSKEMAPDAAYPRLYVIDRQMKVAVNRVNPADDPSIRAEVEAQL